MRYRIRHGLWILGLLVLITTVSCEEKEKEKIYDHRLFTNIGIANGDIEVMEECIEHGFNIYERGSSGSTYLSSAAWIGNVDSVRFLLEKGLDPNIPSYDLTFNINQKKLLTTLRVYPLTSGIRNTEITRLLLEYGADPNRKTADDVSILMHALRIYEEERQNREQILASIRLLLEYGADPNFHAAPSEISPLLLAANYKHRELVDLLLEFGAKPSERKVEVTLDNNKKEWQSELHRFAYCGFVDLLKPYIESGKIKLETAMPDGKDYYYFAAAGGSPEMMMVMLPYIDDINKRRYTGYDGKYALHGMTLIMVAGHLEQMETVKVLLENGADPRIRAFYEDNSEFDLTLDSNSEVVHVIRFFELGREEHPEYRVKMKKK